MNWVRGLFRIWLLFSVLWLASVGYFASKVFWVPVPFYGNYQHSPQIKEMPWKTDWSKPYYEITDAPGKGKFPESFATLDDQYVEKWDADVKAGRTVEINFPDGTYLYLTAQLTKDDQNWPICFGNKGGRATPIKSYLGSRWRSGLRSS
jgi:hypothetical protein